MSIAEENVVIPPREETRTVANVYRPDDNEWHPVILQRSIQSDAPEMASLSDGPAQGGSNAFPRAGYVLVQYHKKPKLCFQHDSTSSMRKKMARRSRRTALPDWNR